MLKLNKVAVTGGVASGKSLFCDNLKELGAYTVDADAVVHQLLSPRTDLGKKVIALLGEEIIKEGKIDRNAVAEKVFQNRNLLLELETILHPAVEREIESQFLEVEKNGKAELFVAEIPLLFETGAEQFFDSTVAVVTNPETALKRFKEKTKRSDEEYQSRRARQLPMTEKAELAHYVVENSRGKEELKKEAEKLFQILRGRL